MIITRLRRCTLVATLGIFLGAGAISVQAQDNYPSRPIMLVVTFAPGAGSDITGRVLAKDLSATLGVPVVVENRPGANGAVGAQFVARAKPDGYTLLVATATTGAVNYAFYPSKLGYEPSSFDIVGTMVAIPMSLYVPVNSPWHNVADLVAAAKRQPGKLNCGSGNATSQVACEYFRKQASIDATTIPYRSNALAFNDLIGGQISYTYSDGFAALPLVEGKLVRAIAVASDQRNPTMPDIGTFREQGIPDFEITAWSAIFAPAGTPTHILEKLNGLIRKSVGTPEFMQVNARSGGIVMQYSLAEASRFAANEVARWARYVKETGVKPE